MKPLKLLDSNFSQIGEIANYESLQLVRSWSDIGSFEMHINRYKRYADSCAKGCYLTDTDGNIFIIRHREIALDENGKQSEAWTIKGFPFKVLTAQRITIPPAGLDQDYKSGPAETVMKHYVDRNLVNPNDPNRKIPNLIIASDQGRGSHLDWQSRYAILSAELKTMSEKTGIGWGITWNGTNLVFDVFEGNDLNADQNANPPVIFSPDFNSIKTQNFVDSGLNYKNLAIVAGQGEGTDRTVLEVGSASGIDRLETFVDARDVSNTDDSGNTIDAGPTLTQRGQDALTDAAQQTYLEAEIISPIERTEWDKSYHFVAPAQSVVDLKRKQVLYGTFKYRQDYDLGDIVTIQNNRWGVSVNEQITEITEVYEPSGFRLSATFGQKQPTIIDKIKNAIGRYENELRR